MSDDKKSGLVRIIGEQRENGDRAQAEIGKRGYQPVPPTGGNGEVVNLAPKPPSGGSSIQPPAPSQKEPAK
jgi:hypothetical protein